MSPTPEHGASRSRDLDHDNVQERQIELVPVLGDVGWGEG